MRLAQGGGDHLNSTFRIHTTLSPSAEFYLAFIIRLRGRDMAIKSDKDQEIFLEPSGLPQHIAIIMDGNGRWAKSKNLPRSMGHRAGMSSLEEVVRTCDELGVSTLTVYAFSTENWKRPEDEVSFLMQLLIEYMKKKLHELHKQGIQIRWLGEHTGIAADIQQVIDRAVELTAHNQGMEFNIALNYGARHELVQACQVLARAVERNELRVEEINEELIASCLYTAGQADPDLLIRTGGESRVSNFLLWQIAYAEIVITEVLWPDFGKQELLLAIKEFQQRDRRFGGLSHDLKAK